MRLGTKKLILVKIYTFFDRKFTKSHIGFKSIKFENEFLNRFIILTFYLFCSFLCADDFTVSYQNMNKEMFHEVVVGNTICGITRQSKSLYMLYFNADGSCTLWKQNQAYAGHWWIDQDPKKGTVVHAFWPTYISSESKSIFSPNNPRYGNPTSLRYCFDPASKGIFVLGKAFQAPVLLAPGCALPSEINKLHKKNE